LPNLLLIPVWQTGSQRRNAETRAMRTDHDRTKLLAAPESWEQTGGELAPSSVSVGTGDAISGPRSSRSRTVRQPRWKLA